MPSFCSREAEGVSSLALMPQIHRIMARSLWRSRCSSGLCGPHASLPWASYSLSRILGDMGLVVRTGKSFLNFKFLRPHNIWQQWQCHSPNQSTPYHLGSRKWPSHQAWRYNTQNPHKVRFTIYHWSFIANFSAIISPCSVQNVRVMTHMRRWLLWMNKIVGNWFMTIRTICVNRRTDGFRHVKLMSRMQRNVKGRIL